MSGLLAIKERLVRSSTAKGALSMAGFFIVARVLTMASQFAAGRTLGPDEFGRANVIIAAAAYLQIVFMLGFHTAVSHFIAAASKASERRAVLSTILLGFVCWLTLSAGAFAAVQERLAEFVGLPLSSLRLSGALAVILSVYTVMASILLGLRRFALRGIFETVYGAGSLALFLFFLTEPAADHRSLISAMLCALVAASLLIILRLRPRLTLRAQSGLLRQSFVYAATASVNVFAAASVTAPARLTAHAAGGASAIGVMSAYFVSSVQPALALAVVMSSFVVPYASDPAGYAKVRSLAWRYALPAGLGLFLLFFAASIAGLSLFGSRYPLRPAWSALFALAAVAHIGHTLGSSLLAARGLGALQLSVAGTVLAAFVTTVLSLPLVARYGPGGGAGALIAGYACSLLFLAWALSTRPMSSVEKTIMTVE